MDSQIIQSPIIGSVLRRALSLDAAGGLPMDAATTVVPVVVVDDVREEVQRGTLRYQALVERQPAVGQYSVCALAWQQFPNDARAIKVKKMTVQMSSAGFFYVGISDAAQAYTFNPSNVQQKVSSVQGSVGAAQPGQLLTANAPGVFGRVSQLLYVASLLPLVIDMSNAPIFITAPNHSVYVQPAATNVATYVTFEYEEELRT